MTATCYAIAALDGDGKSIKYLPFYGEGWLPGTSYRLQVQTARFTNAVAMAPCVLRTVARLVSREKLT